jgi:glycosyltransferase involved in cell wall biosynthesis
MILFDLSITQPSQSYARHGGGVYGEIVFKRIIERRLPVSCFYNSKKYLNDDIKNLLKINRIPLFDIEKRSLEQIVKEEKISRIYSALPHALRNFEKCEVYGTVHGLRPLELPTDSFYFRYHLSWKYRSLIKFVSKILFPKIGYGHERKIFEDYFKNDNFNIITVSNHSAYSIKTFFPETKNKEIKVFYSPSTTSIEINKTVHEEKFFLLVSANRWEKNCLRAVMALDRLFSNGYLKDYKVKITGTKGKTFRYNFNNPNSFEMLGYVDDHELQQLYHDAYCFIYPSLNEGFGYPPLEAMHYGIPVIASSFTSISEVCGDAVLYTNPFSIEEIMNRILMVTDENVHNKLKNKSLNRYKFITQKQNEDLDKLIDYIYENYQEK